MAINDVLPLEASRRDAIANWKILGHDMNFGPQTAKTGPEFSPTLRQLCVFLHYRASHTHFRPQNSTKLYHTEAEAVLRGGQGAAAPCEKSGPYVVLNGPSKVNYAGILLNYVVIASNVTLDVVRTLWYAHSRPCVGCCKHSRNRLYVGCC